MAGSGRIECGDVFGPALAQAWWNAWAAVADGEGLGTILDEAVLAVTLDRPSSFDIPVACQSGDAEALAGADYQPVVDTPLIPAGHAGGRRSVQFSPVLLSNSAPVLTQSPFTAPKRHLLSLAHAPGPSPEIWVG